MREVENKTEHSAWRKYSWTWACNSVNSPEGGTQGKHPSSALLPGPRCSNVMYGFCKIIRTLEMCNLIYKNYLKTWKGSHNFLSYVLLEHSVLCMMCGSVSAEYAVLVVNLNGVIHSSGLQLQVSTGSYPVGGGLLLLIRWCGSWQDDAFVFWTVDRVKRKKAKITEGGYTKISN